MFNRNFLESPHTEEERIPHPELLDVLDKTRRFYNDPKSIEFLKSQFESLAHLFRFKDYYVGILGVGYPFYNLNQEGFGELDEFEKQARADGFKFKYLVEKTGGEWKIAQVYKYEPFNKHYKKDLWEKSYTPSDKPVAQSYVDRQ